YCRCGIRSPVVPARPAIGCRPRPLCRALLVAVLECRPLRVGLARPRNTLAGSRERVLEHRPTKLRGRHLACLVARYEPGTARPPGARCFIEVPGALGG